jgi:tetratricopeptide (TPR) repeat protein
VNAQDMPKKFMDLQNKLLEFSQKEKYKLLKKAIKENPNEPWYYWLLADSYEFEMDTKNVVKYYEKSIELDSKFVAGHESLARFYYFDDSTQLDKALMHISKAIELEPTNDKFYIVRANIYLKKKKYDLAIKNAHMVLDLPNSDPYPAYEVIVTALYTQKKYAELNALLKKVDLSNVFYGTTFEMLLGNLYENINENKKACNCYRFAAVPYETAADGIPANIEIKLKKCKH